MRAAADAARGETELVRALVARGLPARDVAGFLHPAAADWSWTRDYWLGMHTAASLAHPRVRDANRTLNEHLRRMGAPVLW